MRRILPILLLLSGVYARPAAAQNVLPASFAGWNASGASSAGQPSGTTSDSNNGVDPAILKEYFLKSVETRAYATGDPGAGSTAASGSATATLYRFRDPSAAYGAYTFLRDDSLSPVTLGSFGSASHDRALIVIGDYLLDVGAKPARPSDADLKQLVDPLAKVADKTPFPTIGQHLPEKGLVHRSEHYVLGPRTLSRFVPLGTDDWMGYNDSAESIVARYRLAGKSGANADETLLITLYPTQQIAADKFAGMLRRFTFDPPGGVAPGQTALFGKRSSALVAVVVGAPSREAANALLDQVQYETQVTWDEPKHTLTDPSISSIVIGAFLGTGAIMILALAVGIGFGGLRVILKVFLPNKVFDREKEIEILQLGIYSKPIRATDFYQKPTIDAKE